MSKFYGHIGYAVSEEVERGVWQENIVEKEYVGDLLAYGNKLSDTGGVNDDVRLDNRISIITDDFMDSNYQNIRYVRLNDSVRWKVRSVKVLPPRLVIIFGGVYNG